MESLESTALEIYDSEARKHFLSDIVRILRDWKTVFAVALVELNNRYKKTALGAIWSILNPLLTSLIVYFIFGRLFNGYLPGERGYFFWVFSGFMLQIYLLQGIIIVTNQILGNLNLITNYRVNPLLISFSAGLSTSFNFLIGSLALVPAALISGHAISPRIFFVPLFALMVTMFISGCSMYLLNPFKKYDDSMYIVGLLIMIVGYLSPFLYPFAILKPPLLHFVSLNPLTSYILTFRWLVLEGQLINPIRILVVIGTSVAVFLLGAFFLRRRWNETLML